MKPLYLCIVSILLCTCCKKAPVQNPVPTITIQSDRNTHDLDISSIVDDSLEIIKLETTDSCLIGFINKILFSKDYIFVSDQGISQKIYMFDRNGNFIRTISNKGNGPKEYSIIGDIAISGDSMYIQDYYLNKYIIYDMKNNQMKADLPYQPHHSGVLAFGSTLYFISNYFTSPLGDYNCFQYNLSTKKINGYLPFSSKDIKEKPIWTINHTCGKIDESHGFAFYRSNDTIYQFEHSEIHPQYVIHFDKDMETQETLSKNEGNISGIIHLQQSSGYMLGTYIEGKGFKYFLIDKQNISNQTGKYLRIKTLDNKAINYEYFIENEHLIFWDTMQSLKLWRNYFNQADFSDSTNKQKLQNIIDASKEDDNPVIFKYKIKNNI